MKSYSPSCLSNYTPTVRIQVITACCQSASSPIRCRKRTHQKQKQKGKKMDFNQITKFPPREAILVHFIYKKGLEERIKINK